MLRSRRGSLTATFARHGITLNQSVLADTTRRLISAHPLRLDTPTRTAHALRRLDASLDDLEERLVAAR